MEPQCLRSQRASSPASPSLSGDGVAEGSPSPGRWSSRVETGDWHSLLLLLTRVEWPAWRPGWAVASDVLAWSADRLFTVGDTLWFAYSAEDGSVVEVGGEAEFESCDAGSPVRMYTEGLSRVALDGEGSRYFVSADPAKCSSGLKLRVDVRAPVAGTTPPLPLRKDDRAAAPAPAPAPWTSSGGRGVATSRTRVMLCCLLFLAI
ncbi:hypothetical protein E2562_035087 [Oryza meyeriana var. granulata]|uniref:Phytocyanin domain-containing protein n=1 Tax=Oryza meyeriana var. granulata TaxID=110450 RepID=A0A6G1FFB6_9ORYZ|nr:hypothetical protein E2562_035087 [Oryza meyeriana var. granulata]